MAPSATSPVTAEDAIPAPIHPSFIPKLDKDFIEYYNAHVGNVKSTHEVTIQDIRAFPAKYASVWYKDYSYEPFVKDIKITADDGHVFTARIYKPDPSTSPFGDGPYPIHINFHGGGFTFGGLEGDAELCMTVRTQVGVMLMDVDYRLSPEHDYGKGHDDCWAAVKWVREHGSEINARSDSISIGGISAGGTISAVIQQQARDIGLPLKLAFLGVPLVASHMYIKEPEESPYPSMVENALAPTLSWSRLKYFQSHYTTKSAEEKAALEARGVFFSDPVDGNLEGLCPTFIATAEADPLRDEGEEYAARLAKAGVKTTLRRYTGVPHPFMHMRPIKKAVMYVEDYCSAVKQAHGA